MKITDYTINNLPDPDTEYVVVAYNGLNYKILNGNLNFFAPHNKQIPTISDLVALQDGRVFPTSGTPTQNSTDNHPGQFSGNLEYTKENITTVADYVWLGGETIEIVFRIDTANGVAVYLGMFKEPGAGTSRGVFVQKASASQVITGYMANASGTSSTTTYTLTTGTWYRLKITVNTANTRTDFFLYDSNGTLIWTDGVNGTVANLTSGINSDLVRSGDSGSVIDWVAFYNNTELVR